MRSGMTCRFRAPGPADPSAGGNPIPVDAAALERIFRAAVAGTLEAIPAA